MKIRWRRAPQCGKRSFVSELDAQLALVRSQRRARLEKGPKRAKVEIRHYFCRMCKGYHLTSEPLRTQPRNPPLADRRP